MAKGAKNVKNLNGKYRLKNKEIRLAYKGNLTNSFIDDGKENKGKILPDLQDLKDGIKGIMILSSNRKTWNINDESDVYNKKKNTVLMQSGDIIVEVEVPTLQKYFKKVEK